MPGELAASFLGLELVSPVIVGACPLTLEPEIVRQLIGAGAGAIVLPSMLQEQIVHRQLLLSDPLEAVERSGYQPQQDKYNSGVENYLHSISSLKKTCSVPVIASMNGTSTGDWLDYAKEIESAGADALEVNVQSAVFDPKITSDSIESRLCKMVANIAEHISIPIAVKITQRYTNVASMACQLGDAGAKGITLFTHLPHWDVCTDRMHWTVNWELSPADSLAGILEGIVRVYSVNSGMLIAASGGINTSEDAVKSMIAGADVVMVTSAVYREGPHVIRKMVDGIQRYLEINHHQTLRHFLQARPPVDTSTERVIRLEYVDPLTRSKTYFDPTPTASHAAGDAYGHIHK